MELQLINPDDGSVEKVYVFLDGVSNIRDTVFRGQSPFNQPGKSWKNSRFISFQGQSREITFDFDIKDADIDRSNSETDTANVNNQGVKTALEQRDWLFEDIFLAGSDRTWVLKDNSYYPSGQQVSIEEIDINIESEEPLRFFGTASFIIGENILLDIDIDSVTNN